MRAKGPNWQAQVTLWGHGGWPFRWSKNRELGALEGWKQNLEQKGEQGTMFKTF